MNNSALIGIINEEDEVSFIYCHLNGEPDVRDSVGDYLKQYYNDYRDAQNLISSGNLLALGKHLNANMILDRRNGYDAGEVHNVVLDDYDFNSSNNNFGDHAEYLYLFVTPGGNFADDDWGDIIEEIDGTGWFYQSRDSGRFIPL